MSEQKILVQAKEAAAMLSIGESTLWREVKAERLPKPIKIGCATRWRVADLLQCIADQASQPTTASIPVAAQGS